MCWSFNFPYEVDREAWRAVIHGFAKSQIRLSNWTELNWTDEVIWSWNLCEEIKFRWDHEVGALIMGSVAL